MGDRMSMLRRYFEIVEQEDRDKRRGDTMTGEAQELLWTDEELKLIAFDLATRYLFDKSAGKATPLTQLIHEKLMEMRDTLAAARSSRNE